MSAAEPAVMPPGQPTSAQVDAWQSLSGQVEVRLRPVASPTSLGLFGLAAATLTLAGLQLGWVGPSEGRHVAIVLVALSGVTAALSKVAASMVFVTAGLRIALTGAYHLSGVGWVNSAAGLVGLLLFLMAVYGAWASEQEDATGSSPLPLGRRGKGREAMHGSLMEQVKEIATEPGVRKRV